MNKKVLLGMSGGVDSSVSAILLQKQGYEVVGTTMLLWGNNNSKDDETNIEEKTKLFTKIESKEEQINNYESSVTDAKRVCEKLGIEHYVFDLRDEFQKRVINNFVCEYACAKTPNPCVECNKYMKFQAFYEIAKKLGCDYIATGHYARIKYLEEYKQYALVKSNAEKKDQTYFLYGIDKQILPHVLFPLSEYTDKTEIRKIAEENGLEVATKKDSQEVCFIPDNDYGSFLEQQYKNSQIREDILQNNIKNNKHNKSEKCAKISCNCKGKIILTNGEVLGEHDGLIHYTVGQRKGLGISYKEPLYVIRIDAEKNEVIVGTEKELYSKELIAKDLNFLLDIDLSKPIEIQAKVRYRAKEAEAILQIEDIDKESEDKFESKMETKNNLEEIARTKKIAKVKFKEPQRAITPGQSVVFYLGNIVLGGGKIV